MTIVASDEAIGSGDPVDSASVPTRVARWVQAYISDNGLTVGDLLPSQRDLSSQLRVSRPSVREGLSMLETLGLIRIEKRRGIFVSSPAQGAPADYWAFEQGYNLKDVYEFRANFEPAALALALPHLTGPWLERLEASADALQLAARAGDTVAAAEQDTLFHDLIFEACRNRLYQDIRRKLARVMQDSQWVPMVVVERLKDTAREHRQIFEAIRAQDQISASSALEHHIRAAAQRCDIDLDAPGGPK